MTLISHLLGVPVTRDQLGTLRAGPFADRFRPPPPPLPAGKVFYGVRITKEMWARYEAGIKSEEYRS